MGLASDERAAICDEFERLGPGKATLCAGWDTRDLLAHLLARERQLWAAPGTIVPALAPIMTLAMHRYDSTPWPGMIRLLRGGAPFWSPYRGPLDEILNAAEFFVHHEDARRGEPGWEPRDPDPARDPALWALLPRMGWMLYRRSNLRVVLRRPSGEQHAVKAGSGGVVTIVGEPGELVLHAFGRDAVRVKIEGDPAAIAALDGTARGI